MVPDPCTSSVGMLPAVIAPKSVLFKITTATSGRFQPQEFPMLLGVERQILAVLYKLLYDEHINTINGEHEL
uniref:Uncharacterized protein n=1 Tax=Steinernema glaseri TaxID=37863 RepID=A0A1I7Y7T9_9BILA